MPLTHQSLSHMSLIHMSLTHPSINSPVIKNLPVIKKLSVINLPVRNSPVSVWSTGHPVRVPFLLHSSSASVLHCAHVRQTAAWHWLQPPASPPPSASAADGRGPLQPSSSSHSAPYLPLPPPLPSAPPVPSASPPPASDTSDRSSSAAKHHQTITIIN